MQLLEFSVKRIRIGPRVGLEIGKSCTSFLIYIRLFTCRKDHISKVNDRSVIYEKQFNKVNSDLVDIQKQLSDESLRGVERIPFDGLQSSLTKLEVSQILVNMCK